MHRLWKFLGSTQLFLLITPWLVILIIAGTVAQAFIGLDEALARVFTAYFIWLGGVIPVPGGLLTLAVLGVNLTLVTLERAEFSVQKFGITLSHGAVLAMLVSAALNYLDSTEGYLLLAEGETSAQMRSYTDHDLTVLRDDEPVLVLPFAALSAGQIVTDAALPAPLTLTQHCDHCEAFTPESLHNRAGIAAQITLRAAPMPLQKEEALAGLEFTLNGTHYVSFAALPQSFPQIEAEGARYEFRLERRLTPLPFTIRLIDFEKTAYPGSDAAQEYESLVSIDGQEYAIRMNEPHRAHNVALFQSSYLRRGDKEASILAVTINPFWWTPYAAGLLLLLGLSWQLAVRLMEARR